MPWLADVGSAMQSQSEASPLAAAGSRAHRNSDVPFALEKHHSMRTSHSAVADIGSQSRLQRSYSAMNSWDRAARVDSPDRESLRVRTPGGLHLSFQAGDRISRENNPLCFWGAYRAAFASKTYRQPPDWVACWVAFSSPGYLDLPACPPKRG